MQKAPMWFYILAGVALIWNLMGAMAIAFDFMMTPEMLAQLPEPQQKMYQLRPMWAPFASIVAVGFGVLGCIGLLAKQGWAKVCFIVSILGLIAQNFAFFVLMDAANLAGMTVVYMQSMVFIIAIGLYFLSLHAQKNGWIK